MKRLLIVSLLITAFGAVCLNSVQADTAYTQWEFKAGLLSTQVRVGNGTDTVTLNGSNITFPDSTTLTSSPEKCASGEAYNGSGCQVVQQGQETELEALQLTTLGPGESSDMILYAPVNDTWTVTAMGITDNTFSVPANTQIKLAGQFGDVADTVTSLRDESVSVNYSNEPFAVIIENNSSDTHNLGGHIEVVK